MKNKKCSKKIHGFTLVELVITIAIVIILSVISVPIYRGYVDKAKWSEAYATLGTILSAQKAYFSENGCFYKRGTSWGYTSYDEVLGIDIRGNKYFTLMDLHTMADLKYEFNNYLLKPEDMRNGIGERLQLNYTITTGAKYYNHGEGQYLPK